MARCDIATVPAHIHFADALATGLIAEADDDPAALARMLVLLPTRRAVRAVGDALLRASGGKALLLPRLATLGDIDEDLAFGFAASADVLDLPPAMAPRQRLAVLTRLTQAVQARRGGHQAGLADSMRLARALAHVLDEFQLYRLDSSRLEQVVPDNLADHWRQVLDVLRIATAYWPRELAERGLIDPVERRVLLLESLSQRWTQSPPQTRIVAAGSTGTQPPTAHLLACIARLPNGTVLLPGFDPAMDDELIEAVGATPSHPQHAMLEWVRHAGLAPGDVRLWPHGHEAGSPVRAAAVSRAMLPGRLTGRWRDDRPDPAVWQGLSLLEARTAAEEALAIALAVRETLETPGRTAAVVTPDRALARRVNAALLRFGVTVDDSAGQPLAATLPGSFLALIAETAQQNLAPVPLLALLKHPLAGLGLAPDRLAPLVQRLDIKVLRGSRPAPGIAGLRRAIARERDALGGLLDALERMFAPLIAALAGSDAAAMLAAHLDAAEQLATTDREHGALRLWAHDSGRTAAQAMRETQAAWAELPPVAPGDYADLFAEAVAADVVRRPFGNHARVFLWGALEARLQHADVMILAGLNEGVWPAASTPDPWLNAGLRGTLGLAPLDRRIGQSAHDLVQALGAPRVILTRAMRDMEGPKVASRLWLRLVAASQGGIARCDTYLDWARALDACDRPRPAARPRPAPPVDARPRTISVTQIETLIRDPYAYYARHVLGLQALEPVDAPPSTLERGTAMHLALERYFDPVNARQATGREALLASMRAAFAQMMERPAIAALWWPHLERNADWLLETAADWFKAWRVAAVERSGRLVVEGVTITGKADRIDRNDAGQLAIVDYKTGGPPEAKQVMAGYLPQLPLLALIARAGGFADLPAAGVAELRYWSLGRNAGDFGKVGAPVSRESLDDLLERTRLRAQLAVRHYLLGKGAFVAKPNPERDKTRTDYDQLARLGEWLGREAPDV